MNQDLSKAQKGRLKKLRKRANTVNTSVNCSGIVTEDDWEELQTLQTSFVPSVQIHLKDNSSARNIDAVSHRDLLCQLTKNATGDRRSNRKRQREDTESSFGWACIHNPAAVAQVAVIEVDLSGETADMLSLTERLKSLVESHRRSVTVVKSQWFQTTQKQPQSISDALLYKVHVKNKRSRKHAPAKTRSLTDLVDLLEPLLLTQEQMEKEDYPSSGSKQKAIDHEGLLRLRGSKRLIHPKDISQEDAEVVVQACSVPDETAIHQDNSSLVVGGSTEPSPRRVFALDCEMVQTSAGTELGRVTLVELQSFSSLDTLSTHLLFDAIVRPKNTVVNYLTEYSGLTAVMLNDVKNTKSLEQVQAALLVAVRPNDIVIGHSLENDLWATRWIHETVIDTAVLLQQSERSFKHSLRHLSAVLLKKHIQRADNPHCSEEDAVTALELAVRRAVEGPSFRMYEKPSRTSWLTELSSTSTAVCVGPTEWLQKHILSSTNAAHAVELGNLEDPNVSMIASWLSRSERSANLMWAKFTIQDEMDALERLVDDLLTKLAANCVLLVALQNGYDAAAQLTETRRVRRNPKTTLSWSDQEEDEWNAVLQKCRDGQVLWIGGPIQE